MSQDSFPADELFQGLTSERSAPWGLAAAVMAWGYFKLCLYYTIVYTKAEPAVLFCFFVVVLFSDNMTN